ncbi:unnamed protein product [Lactuca saligna]|uniref:Uncharacterized protein n=1 Tax=Lactuca saligna TaxID=75948 RepID=A0AA35YVY2_LACSI|nr:unnamed protein product [Lactuca saligna]
MMVGPNGYPDHGGDQGREIKVSSSQIKHVHDDQHVQSEIDILEDHKQQLHVDEGILVQYPNQIYESMCYSVLVKGAKRAPLVVCVTACELHGGNRLAALPTAFALEMVLRITVILKMALKTKFSIIQVW